MPEVYMKKFMDGKFLLESGTAVEIFESIKALPIIDYHCHLNPDEIVGDKHFANITELALGGDHYKWRLMRANGVLEEFITGKADDFDKFYHWCKTLEDAIGSPLYHWTHLEMRRYFHYDGEIGAHTAKDLFDFCNKVIRNENFSAWGIFEKFKVEQIGTTDDPADSLWQHIKMTEARKENPKLPVVYPTFRPSKVLGVEDADFPEYIRRLEDLAGQPINGLDDLKDVLAKRLEHFHQVGCRLSDHALDPPVFYESEGFPADKSFTLALGGLPLTKREIDAYKTALMVWLGKEYAKRGWVMQLHMGALRGNNTKMQQKIGADTGFDSMSDTAFAKPLARLLDAMSCEDLLPKTILYGLNPMYDTMLATMIGNFQGGGVPGKIQWGSAWWFNDTKTGMENHITTLANCGMLARFVGMLTDSRSFMSYPRHEYFRRILANTLANWVERGEFPKDMNKLTHIAKNIAYHNAKKYFARSG